MKKLLLISVLTLSLFTITGCGKQATNDASTPSSVEVSTPSPTETTGTGEAATATAAPDTEAVVTTATPDPTQSPNVLTRIKQETSYKADGTLSYQFVYEYDAVGNNIKKTSVDVDGNVKNWYAYEYDAAGNRTNEAYYLADGSLSMRKETVYNDAGVKTQYTVYNADGSISSQKNYNDDGVLLEEIGGVQAPRVVYALDTENRITKIEYYDDYMGGLYAWEEYAYDGTGSATITLHTLDGLTSTTFQEYDAAGNLLGEGGVSSGTKILTDAYTYDDAGNLLNHSTYNSDGQCTSYTSYTYNANNQMTFMGEYDSDGTLMVWSDYEYDEKGALVKYIQEDMMGMKFPYVNRSFVYGEDGKPTEEITYNSSGEIYSRIIYEYVEITVEK